MKKVETAKRINLRLGEEAYTALLVLKAKDPMTSSTEIINQVLVAATK